MFRKMTEITNGDNLSIITTEIDLNHVVECGDYPIGRYGTVSSICLNAVFTTTIRLRFGWCSTRIRLLIKDKVGVT